MTADAALLPLKRLAEERKKKRIAQKLYRVRKKDELQDLENQLAEVSQKLSDLTAENLNLRQKVKVLAEIISCRDAFIAGLSRALTHPNRPPILDFNPGQSTETASGTSPPSTDTTANPDVRSKAPWQVTRVSVEEVSKAWKNFLAELSVVMLGCDDGTCSPEVEAKILKLYQDKLDPLRCAYFLDQLCFLQVISFNLEEWKPKPAGEEHWLAVVDAIHLTEQQRHDLVDAFEVGLKVVERLHPSRQELLDKVLAACESNVHAVVNGDGRWANIQLLEHTERLHQLIKQEIDVTVLMATFLHKIMTVVQRARLAIQSYPFIPDSYSIMQVLFKRARSSSTSSAESAQGSRLLLQGSSACTP